MKFILLYGPPAVGKLTVAKILAEKTGITLFHNHMILNVISELFGYDHPARKTLEYEFRLRIIEEAAKADKDLIVTTGGVGPEYFDRFREFIETVEKHSGEVCIVRLTAPKEIILERVAHESRKQHKKLSSIEEWKENFKKHPGLFDTFPDREHISIDTAENTPDEVVEKIVQTYHLNSS